MRGASARYGRRRSYRSHSCRGSHVRGDLVVDGERGQRDDDGGPSDVLWTEAFDHRRKVRQDALVEIGLQREGEFGLTAALVRKGENPHHGAAGRPLAQAREQRLERESEGPAREELVATD